MKKFFICISVIIMTAIIAFAAACTPIKLPSDDDDKPVTYTVTLNTNGGTLSTNLTSYTKGVETALPLATKSGYEFVGWFTNADLSGSPVTKIASTESGNRTFWAKWKETSSTNPDPTNPDPTNPNNPTTPDPTNPNPGDTTEPTTYTVTLNANGGTLSSTLSSYTAGTETPLPSVTKTNYTFGGWYDNAEFTGTAVTKILATDSGNKTYYAKWTPTGTSTQPSALNLTAKGYCEGAYAEFEYSGSSASVTYRKADGVSEFKTIDSQLLRKNGNKYRADILGISAGNYEIKVTAGAVNEVKTVSVTAYDRSGYAHFKKDEGIGAYNNDGTPKTSARIVYVTEATKNTVTVSGISGSGIVNILNGAGTSKPLIVRIIGTVGAATWKEGNITYTKTSQNTDDKGNLLPSAIVGKNGSSLSQKEWNQDDLIAGKFNELDDSKYKVLNGLTSKIKWDSSKSEYDSCWNDCQVNSVKNVTVEGVGTDARIFQWGMTFKTCNSIEVRNLTFEDYTEDACSFEGAKGEDGSDTPDDFTTKNFWVHHNTFEEGVNYWDVCKEQDKHDGDGSTDFKYLSYATISYNRYNKTHKTGLVGGSNSHHTASITFHHNYYNGCKARLPLARQANLHIYNNYYNGTTSCDVSLRANAYALIENCYFESVNKMPIELQFDAADKEGEVDEYGAAKVLDCNIDKNKIVNYYSNPNDKTDKSNLLIGTAKDREAKVTNNNGYDTQFDTNTNLFYYDSTNKKSDVTIMNTAAEVKANAQKFAGCLGDTLGSDWNTGDSGSTPSTPSTPTDPTDPSDQPENPPATTGKVLSADNCGVSVGQKFTQAETEYYTLIGVNTSNYTVTALETAGGGTTATATDSSGLSFSNAILPNSSGASYTITAKKDCTITVYYTVSNSDFNNKSQTKSGYLTWTIDGGSSGADTNQANKDGRKAYAVTITLKANQVCTIKSSSSNKLVLFAIVVA